MRRSTCGGQTLVVTNTSEPETEAADALVEVAERSHMLMAIGDNHSALVGCRPQRPASA